MNTPYDALFAGAVSAAAAALASGGFAVTLSANPPPEAPGDLVIPSDPIVTTSRTASHKGRHVPELSMSWLLLSQTAGRPAAMAKLLDAALASVDAAPFAIAAPYVIVLSRLAYSAPAREPGEAGVAPYFGHTLRYDYTVTTT